MTPFNAVAYAVIAMIFIGGIGGIVWAVTGWRKASRTIDEAVAMVCEYCRKGSLLARCTCPDGGCGITWCEKRPRVRRG